jgi:hyperpolarization activated cyclic nucleotide-gated potassium channel 2
LARLHRLYRLLRIFRVVRLFKIGKYAHKIKKLVDYFNLTAPKLRLYKFFGYSLLLMHLMCCFFFLSARMNDFESNTWVNQTGLIDEEHKMRYMYTIYWACQTLTTVGYGDFGCYNDWEIAITCVWMFLGVAVYTVVVG